MSLHIKTVRQCRIEATFDAEMVNLVDAGKTRVLTCRVAYLVKDCGIKPEDLIVVTFTNKVSFVGSNVSAQLVDLHETRPICYQSGRHRDEEPAQRPAGRSCRDQAQHGHLSFRCCQVSVAISTYGECLY